MKYVVFLCLVLSSHTLWAQDYSEEELNTFAKIYAYQTQNPFDVEQATQTLLTKNKISFERFGEIMRAKIQGQNPQLTEQEKKQLASFENDMKQAELQYKSNLKKYVVANDMTEKQYEEMLQRYQTSTNFQKKVYPILKNQLKP